MAKLYFPHTAKYQNESDSQDSLEHLFIKFQICEIHKQIDLFEKFV